jgi:hypothetical protein
MKREKKVKDKKEKEKRESFCYESSQLNQVFLTFSILAKRFQELKGHNSISDRWNL